MTTNNLPAARPLEPQPKAIVVGASSGIGAALVQELVRQGYVVGAVARREAKLREVCERANLVGGAKRAIPYVHDVSDFAKTEALFQHIVQEMGGVDLVVYVAGVQPAVALDEYNFAKDAEMVGVNLLGAMAWLNLAALRFERAKAGHIVAISSIAGDRGRRAFPGYHASKGGLTIYVESLRNRLSRYGVTVTTIKPGFVETALLANASKTFWVISPESAAEQIGQAIRRKKQTVYVPGRWSLVSLIIRHIPSFIFRRMSI